MAQRLAWAVFFGQVLLSLRVPAQSSTPRCNVSIGEAKLPCSRARCRHILLDGGANITQRGLHYPKVMIDRFIGEFEMYTGYIDYDAFYFVHLLATLQSDAQVFGGIGEIGTAVGKSFVMLTFTRRSDERLFAADIFAGLNTGDAKDVDAFVEEDNVAWASLPQFLATVRRAGINPTNIAIHDGSSLDLTDTALARAGVVPFRLLHIDGGHYLEAVVNDLRLAACTLAPGGIILLDDWNTRDFPGAQEGFHRFMLMDRPRLRPELEPFLVADRLYLADREYAAKYRETLRRLFPRVSLPKIPQYLYGAEVLNPNNNLGIDVSDIKKLIMEEEEYFPWPAARRPTHVTVRA